MTLGITTCAPVASCSITAEAADMLARLSDRTHSVLTAVSLKYRERTLSRLNATEVRFRATTKEERIAYCRTGEPMGKAGSYAIQGRGAVFVEHLNGSYSAVVGLPLAETADLLGALGYPLWPPESDRMMP